ncbi:carboxymuconolactone decarboxylase family protein [Endozoicomonas sp. SM1973]|uniref:Carboxymuconolactone decarboxylase family protein n=1 Tax=Spartinivicinus marinus TaxID=2994442 RepID=A0A853IAN0_9GAMM|nr:carboxymuconolactone decarboxylase family protein [Spartinivicinus marinus]MCX4028639.1 carboxymuconolactone decarboxylase family protein [Spartinivicinus marinus]NYZ67094.1 carboxymuconolactone decarboxylase family protein [Spartinivicinus marinus]
MTRIPYIDKPTGLSDEQKAVYDYIYQSRKKVVGVFSFLLNSPPLAQPIADLGAYLRFDSILPANLKEIVILVTLSENYCQFEWSAHEELALKAGISQETIDVIKYKRSLTDVELREQTIIHYGRELINNKRVSDTVFTKCKQQFNKTEITEITTLMGYYSMVACILNAFGLGPQPGKPSLPEPSFNQPTASSIKHTIPEEQSV